MTDLIFLDTETTGLDPAKHDVWEIAWARETGDVQSFFVEHVIATAEPKALDLNGYHDRFRPEGVSHEAENYLMESVLPGATIVASNPSFDTQFLYERWGEQPWHHRKVDIATYAMPWFGADRPVGLAQIAAGLGVEQPDHTAEQDVLTLRKCFFLLRQHYAVSNITKENA